MNRSVMLSIHPKWCALIADGRKTVEIRTTRPKIDPPFKCYIYETKSESEIPWVDEDGHFIFKGRGAVIGEFVCDWIIPIIGLSNGIFLPCGETDLKNACLSNEELIKYFGLMGDGYAWNISDIVIYDTPRPLSDFGLRRPPQSWCYAKEVNIV